jgi:hypothetical protein
VGEASHQGHPVVRLFDLEGGPAFVDPASGHGISRTWRPREHGFPAVVETPIYGAFIKPEEIRKTLAGFNAFHPIGRVLFMRSSISAKIPKRSKSAFPNRHIRSKNNVNSAA